MKITSKLQKVGKFQMGGSVPPQDTASAQAADQTANQTAADTAATEPEDPMVQILQVAAQAVQTQNCEAAMAVCQALIDLVAQAQGGGSVAPQEPTFARNGARLVRVN